MIEFHGLRIHQEKFRVHVFPGGSLVGHLHLNRSNRNSCGLRTVIAGKKNAAWAKTTADVQNPAARFDSGYLGEMLDELKLGLFLCFVSANPVAMMQVLAPKIAVVGAYTIIMIPYFFLIAIAGIAHTDSRANGWVRWRLIDDTKTLPLSWPFGGAGSRGKTGNALTQSRLRLLVQRPRVRTRWPFCRHSRRVAASDVQL